MNSNFDILGQLGNEKFFALVQILQLIPILFPDEGHFGIFHHRLDVLDGDVGNMSEGLASKKTKFQSCRPIIVER